MHANSLEAYQEQRGKLSRRARDIYSLLLRYPSGLTDRQVKTMMFVDGDMNMVRPRITELIADGWLEELRDITYESGHPVRIVRAKTMQEIIADSGVQKEMEFI